MSDIDRIYNDHTFDYAPTEFDTPRTHREPTPLGRVQAQSPPTNTFSTSRSRPRSPLVSPPPQVEFNPFDQMQPQPLDPPAIDPEPLTPDPPPRSYSAKSNKMSAREMLLVLTNDRLAQSQARVTELDAQVVSLMTVLRQVNASRDAAILDAAELRASLAMWKTQYARSQEEVVRAGEMLRRVERRAEEAEARETEMRGRMRGLAVEKAVEEGRRQGFSDGWRQAERERMMIIEHARNRERERDEIDETREESRRRSAARNTSEPPGNRRRAASNPASSTSARSTSPPVASSQPSIPLPPPSLPPPVPPRKQTPVALAGPSTVKPRPPPVIPRTSSPAVLTTSNLPPINIASALPSAHNNTYAPFAPLPDNFIPIVSSSTSDFKLPPPHELTRPVPINDQPPRPPTSNSQRRVATPAPEPPVIVSQFSDGAPPIVQISLTPRNSMANVRGEQDRVEISVAPPSHAPVIPSSEAGHAFPPVIPDLSEIHRPTTPGRTSGNLRLHTPKGTSRSRRLSTTASTVPSISNMDILEAPSSRGPNNGMRVEMGRAGDASARSREKVASWRNVIGGQRVAYSTDPGEGPSQIVHPPTNDVEPTTPLTQYHAHPASASTRPYPYPIPSSPIAQHDQQIAVMNIQQESPRNRPTSPMNWLRRKVLKRGMSSSTSVPIHIVSPSEPSVGLSTVPPALAYPNRDLLTPEPQTLTTPAIQEYIDEHISPRLDTRSIPAEEEDYILPQGFVPHSSSPTIEPAFFNGAGPVSSTPASYEDSMFIGGMDSGSSSTSPLWGTSSSRARSKSDVKGKSKKGLIRPTATYDEVSDGSTPVLIQPHRRFGASSPPSAMRGSRPRGSTVSGDGVNGDYRSNGEGASTIGSSNAGDLVSRRRAMSVGSAGSAPLNRPLSMFSED